VFIIGIISSPSSKGNTSILVQTALKEAENHGARTKMLFLPDLHIEFCRGCFHCTREGNCIINDDMRWIIPLMEKANGFILGSPTYALNANAYMNRWIERFGMLSVYTSRFGGKYCVGFSTAGGFGAKSVAKKLTGIFDGVKKHSYRSGYLGVLVGLGRIQDFPKQIKKAETLGAKISHDIQHKRAYPLQKIGSKLLNRFILQRAFRKNILRNKEGVMKYVNHFWNEQGW